MPQAPASLAEAFPFAPVLPLLQVPHPVHFPGHTCSLTDFNFAQLVTLPGHPLFIQPWYPNNTPLPRILTAALHSLQHPCPDTNTLIFLMYIWAVPDIQQLLSQDPRLASTNWKEFCNLIADAFPARAHLPPRQLSSVLQTIPKFAARCLLTLAHKASLVCHIWETLRISDVLVTTPVSPGAPHSNRAQQETPLAILRQGPTALENTFIHSEAAWDSSQNAFVQVLRLFDERGDDNLHDCTTNIITTILQAQQYSLMAITATQELERHIAELRETIDQHPHILADPQQATTAVINLFDDIAEPTQHVLAIDLTLDE